MAGSILHARSGADVGAGPRRQPSSSFPRRRPPLLLHASQKDPARKGVAPKRTPEGAYGRGENDAECKEEESEERSRRVAAGIGEEKRRR